MDESPESKSSAEHEDFSSFEAPFGPEYGKLSLDEVFRLCEEQLPRVLAHPEFKVRWTRDKVDVPFEL
jgi:hypothetical protein